MTTRRYFTNSVASYNPPTLRGTYNNTSLSANVFALAAAKAGANAAAAVAETSTTNNYKAFLHKHVSEPITGGTFSSTDGTHSITITHARLESSTNANMNGYYTVYVTQGNSDTVRGTLINSFIGATEFATSATILSFNLTFDNTVVAQPGDRIVVEIGYNAANTSATSFTGTIRYGGTAADLATSGTTGVTANSPWIDFSTPLDSIVAPYTHDPATSGTNPVVRSVTTDSGINTDTSLDPAKPSGLVVDDLLLGFQVASADGALASMTAAGFVELASQAGHVTNNYPFVKIWGKLATSADTSASTFNFADDAAGESVVILTAIQKDTFDPFDWITTPVWTTTARTSNQAITSPTTANVLDGLLLSVLSADTNGVAQSFSTPPTGMTEVADVTDSSAFALCGLFKEILTTGTGNTGTRTATPTPSSTTNGWTSAALVINPGPVTSTTHQGAVALAPSATFSTDGTVVKPGAVSLSATATLASESARTTFGAVSLSASATLTSAALLAPAFASVELAPSATLTTDAIRTTFGTVSLAPSATLTATGAITHAGAVSLSASASLATESARTTFGAVTLNTSQSLTATGTLLAFGAVSLTASPTLTADGIRTTAGAVSLSATATLSVAGAVTHDADVTLTASATLEAQSIRTTFGVVSLSSTPTLTAGVSQQTLVAAISLSAAATLSAEAIRITFGVVNLSVSATLVATAGGLSGSVSLTPTATLTANAIRTTFGVIDLTVASTLATESARTTFASVGLTVSSTLTVSADRYTSGAVTLAVESSLTANATTFSGGGVTLTVGASLTATARLTVFAAVGLTVAAQLSATAILTARAQVSLTSSSTLSVTAFLIQPATIALNVGSTFAINGVTVKLGAAGFTVSASLTVNGIRITFAVLTLQVNSVLTAEPISSVPGAITLSVQYQLLTQPSMIAFGSVSLVAMATMQAIALVGGWPPIFDFGGVTAEQVRITGAVVKEPIRVVSSEVTDSNIVFKFDRENNA